MQEERRKTAAPRAGGMERRGLEMIFKDQWATASIWGFWVGVAALGYRKRGLERVDVVYTRDVEPAALLS